MRNDWKKKATTGQKPSRRRTNVLIWDELVTTMSTNITLEFLATKAKLKQENPMTQTLAICKEYVPRHGNAQILEYHSRV